MGQQIHLQYQFGDELLALGSYEPERTERTTFPADKGSKRNRKGNG